MTTPGAFRGETPAGRKKSGLCLCALVALCALGGALGSRSALAQSLDSLVQLDIKPQPLDKALLEFGRQAHIQIMFAAKFAARRMQTVRLKGEYVGKEALTDLLRGSDLVYLDRGSTVEIVRAPVAKSEDHGETASASAAASDPAPAPDPSPQQQQSDTTASQTAGPPAPGAAPEVALQQVVVTGSRLFTQKTQLTPSPVDTIVSNAYLNEHGYTSVANALNSLPEVQASITPAGAQNVFGVGVNYINLYGLGTNRTLDLVNGLRFVSDNPANIFANQGGTQVDFNDFPSIFLDKIDVVPASGAAVYGADAVAGVANVQMLQRYEGAEMRASVSNSREWDAGEYNVEAAFGRDFFDHKMNLAFDTQYDQTTALSDAQRPYTALQQGFVPNPAYTGQAGVPAQIVANNIRFYGVTNAGLPINENTGGLITLPGTQTPVQFGNNGNLVPFNPGVVYGPAAGNGLDGNPLFDSDSSGGDSYNLAPSSSLQAPLKRALFYGIGSYDFTDWLHFNTAVSFDYVGARQAFNQPNYSYPGFGVSPTYNTPAPGTAWLISSQNAFLNSQAQSILNGDGIGDFYLSRTNIDATPSPISAFVRTLNINSVLSGDFNLLDRRFDWNVSYSHGQAYSSYSSYSFIYGNPAFGVPNLLGYALDSVVGANGQPQCRVTADNPGSTNPYIKNCVPFNPFGLYNNSAAAINYVTANVGNTALNWQDDAQANIQAPLVNLPAGAARASLGLESRYEYASFDPSAASQEGIGYFVATPQTHGHFGTHEVYGEMNVPLLGEGYNWPFAHTLDLDGAYRHVESSLAGSNDAWNYGLVYAPTQDVGIRLGRASTYREPSLQEAYSPQTGAFDYGEDPCQASNINSGPNPAARQRNCATAFAALGANLADFTSSNVENYTIPVTSGGNPNLENEVAHSLNIGFVLTPRWVDGLSVSADYIQVIVTDAIEYAGVANLMEECYDSPAYPSSTCADFTRQPGTGQVVSANETFINEGYNHLRLIQYKVEYQHSLEAFPLFNRLHNPGGISFTTNVVDMRENNASISGKGFDTIESANTATTTNGVLPRWSINADLGYHRDPWQVHWQTFYQSRMYFDLTYTAANQLPLSIPSSTTHELDVLYNFNEHFQIGAHVFNVFDKAPPQPWAGYPVTGLGRLFELTGRAIF
jgi:iron complex outermembrane receptor protein